MKKYLILAMTAGGYFVMMAAAAAPAIAGEFETGTNISGESSASERRTLIKDAPQEPAVSQDVRIVVPTGPNGLPQRPVRGLSKTEKEEMNDLEFRYQMGQIGEAEYIQRRNDMMQRIGLEPEF
jgi:hypothetical protein